MSIIPKYADKKVYKITDYLYTLSLLHISAIIWVLFKFKILYFSRRISRKISCSSKKK